MTIEARSGRMKIIAWTWSMEILTGTGSIKIIDRTRNMTVLAGTGSMYDKNR